MIRATAFPIAYLAIGLWRGWEPLGRQWPMLALASAVAVLIIWRHRGNLVRLWKGTEMRSG